MREEDIACMYVFLSLSGSSQLEEASPSLVLLQPIRQVNINKPHVPDYCINRTHT